MNGNWGSWGRYGSCNNKCGGGVQERFRTCNNPAPAHGGSGCPGYSKMVKACNTQACTGMKYFIWTNFREVKNSRNSQIFARA